MIIGRFFRYEQKRPVIEVVAAAAPKRGQTKPPMPTFLSGALTIVHSVRKDPPKRLSVDP